MLFIVSEVELRSTPGDVGAHAASARAEITIERAGGVKCERCWRYVRRGVERSGMGRVCANGARMRWRSRSMAELASRRPRHAERRCIEFGCRSAIVVARPGHEGASSGRRCRCTKRRRSSPACWISRTSEHRRGVRLSQRRRLPVQDARSSRPSRWRRSSASRSTRSALPAHQLVARDRPGAHPRRRRRQPDRPVDVGLRGRFRRRLLARLSFLGVQRGGLGHHDRRGDHDPRHARRGTHVSKTV